jgi:cell division protein FtsI/penicillin-binding protein 2
VRSIALSILCIIITSSQGTDPFQQAVTRAMNGRQGAAVALDVVSGRILASYRMDVAARRLASPGSAIKPFTLMALVEEGVVTERTAFMCPITVRVGGRQLDCSHPASPSPFGAIQAIAHSCNHFFVHASEGLSKDALYRVFSRAGLNSPTGKWETEIAGSLKEPGSAEDVQLMSIGESSVTVTPLGLAEAYRSLALRLRDAPENDVESRLILKGLEAAVEQGTGRAAAAQHVHVAGKTGTADGHAWFAGFAPAERPQIVVLVFLERGTGGSDAAPVAGRIFAALPHGTNR